METSDVLMKLVQKGLGIVLTTVAGIEFCRWILLQGFYYIVGNL